MTADFEFTDYYDAYAASGGSVQLQFVDAPTVRDEHVEWSFRTVGGATAPAGTVVAAIAVMSHDHNIIGGGKTTIRDELGPHDVGASRVNPVQYTPQDGDYYMTVTVGSDARNVSYRVQERRVYAS
jgi:hypothetical protein